MRLAREKFLKLLKEAHRLHEKGVSIRMIGEVSLLPMSVRQPAAELEAKTRHNNKYKLNICIAYTRNSGFLCTGQYEIGTLEMLEIKCLQYFEFALY